MDNRTFKRILNRFKRLSIKIVKKQSHIAFLQWCLSQNIIPKGFTIKWNPSYNPTTTQKDTFDTILNQTAKSLITQVISRNDGDEYGFILHL